MDRYTYASGATATANTGVEMMIATITDSTCIAERHHTHAPTDLEQCAEQHDGGGGHARVDGVHVLGEAVHNATQRRRVEE